MQLSGVPPAGWPPAPVRCSSATATTAMTRSEVTGSRAFSSSCIRIRSAYGAFSSANWPTIPIAPLRSAKNGSSRCRRKISSASPPKAGWRNIFWSLPLSPARLSSKTGPHPEAIRVIPYGVDLERFAPPGPSDAISGPLRLLFVGTINQRKGIKYLLEALRLVGPAPVELTVCGRVVDDLSLFRPFGSQVRVRPSVSLPELLEAYRQADLFVLPSVAEGFGQVLLEALASGLPVLSTTHTAAPDLIVEGREGFIVEPRRPDLFAARIDWALDHRAELRDMKFAARQRAEHFTWARFQSGVVDAVRDFMGERQPSASAGSAEGLRRRAPEYV